MRVLAGVLLLSFLPATLQAQVAEPASAAQKTSMNSPAEQEATHGLMPRPRQLEISAGFFPLSERFAAHVTGFQNPRLDKALQRTFEQLGRRTGISFTQPVDTAASAPFIVDVQNAGESVQSLDEDESYTLVVTTDQVRLKAQTVVGAMRGLQTLVQLVQVSEGKYVLPAVSIEDAPRFRWRGLMIDCGRHFEPVENLKRMLDGMAAVKLNVFHWHLTEDQGFRIESKIYPRLTSRGSDGLFYTQAEAAEIVQYARDRGIRVVPEFEMPGHSTAWLVAYPELATARPPSSIRREFGVSDMALDPTREETYKFIARFLGEMATIFPDPYMHIGGDETASPEWKTDPRILAFMRAHQLKDPDALQAYFNQRVLKILDGLHKHMVGWDEILNPALPHDVVVQSWRGEKSLVQGAQQGYQGILSAGYYLDGMRSAGEHYLVDPLPSTAALSADQRKLILGGEICMWSEQINERSIDSRVWPRSAAIAERFWSAENVTDVDDMYRRLNAVSIELEGLGLRHLSHEDAAIRELAQTEHIDELGTFASSMEPVGFGERYQQQKTSQLTVLDRFVDAIPPDPPSHFEVELLTRNFLRSPGSDEHSRAALVGIFNSWKQSVPAVQQLIQQTPLMADVNVRAQQLPGLADTGLEAIRLLASAQAAPAGWKTDALAKIKEAQRPAAIVRFNFLDQLTLLITAVRDK